MINLTYCKASELFDKGHLIHIKSAIDEQGTDFDNRDASSLQEILELWYDESDGEISYWLYTQACTMGKDYKD